MNIALFASGTGSNVYNIIQHFKSNVLINVVAVLSNKSDAGALNYAKNANVPSLTFSKKEVTSSIKVEEFLAEKKVELIVLAGFLLKVPESSATRPDGIGVKVLRILGEELSYAIVKFIRRILCIGEWLGIWMHHWICLLFKRGSMGDGFFFSFFFSPDE